EVSHNLTALQFNPSLAMDQGQILFDYDIDMSHDLSARDAELSRENHDLSARDAERGKFAFSIYDFDGNDTMDAFYLGDCLRALNLNPTVAMVEKMGGTKLRKQKVFKPEEFLPIFAEVKNSKDEGNIDDFLEVLKLYDKRDDGTMIFDELKHILMAIGEPLQQPEVDMVLTECCEAEDEDGYIHYEPFLKKMMAGEPAE
ncbi:unnamed protein product, partial [Notodromas monacha]